MNPRDYLRLQLRLEGKDIIHEDLLRQVEVVPGEELPLMIMVQFANGEIFAGYDENLQSHLYEELTKRVRNVIFPTIDLLFDFLKTQNISFVVGHYKTYLFPAHVVDLINKDVRCLSKKDTSVQAFGFGDFAEQVYVIERDGRLHLHVFLSVKMDSAWKLGFIQLPNFATEDWLKKLSALGQEI